MNRVLITGITGFLGSGIAESLCKLKMQVIGLKRSNSNIWRCQDFEEKIDWINLDDVDDWKEKVISKKPTIIIHCAWIGVESVDRDNWAEQIKNIDLFFHLLQIAGEVQLEKFLFLGSQAEYGITTGKISEEHFAKATNAYSSVKLACLELFRTYCVTNRINWIWLRIFSVFGEKESDNWLFPSLINKMVREKEMDFTAGEQQYAYLYIKDFNNIISKLTSQVVESGIYNVSSNEVRILKTIIEKIRTQLNPNFKLNFGVLPYRANQSMHIEGDITKLVNQIGPIDFTNFDVALQNTIVYYT